MNELAKKYEHALFVLREKMSALKNSSMTRSIGIPMDRDEVSDLQKSARQLYVERFNALTDLDWAYRDYIDVVDEGGFTAYSEAMRKTYADK